MASKSKAEDTEQQIARFIERWQKSDAAERANYQLFLSELCDVLHVARPNPTVGDDARNEYVFERTVHFDDGDGHTTPGRIDLYKRACFVLEAKQGSAAQSDQRNLFAAPILRRGTAVRGTAAWDVAMHKARSQAEQYVRALPASEGNPPFILVVDVGHTIELYSDFSRLGKTYTPFPDSQSHRLKLADLAKPEIRQRLASIWTDPLSLDPARLSAKVTREVAARLAKLAKSLEAAGHHAELVAHFLMRCLFTFFAEDTGLIDRERPDERPFTDLLKSIKGHTDRFIPMVQDVWSRMDAGGFAPALRRKLKHFNGKLFKECQALPIDEEQLSLLIDAGEADWSDVEPAIFGTLLERALDDRERHKLGAHYTPRAYVERLVLPTVIEPLREQWEASKAAAFTLNFSDKPEEARKTVREFLAHLCSTMVLDPACGSGNFLYVTMEHMKRLEGEARDLLRELGETQELLERAGLTVDPHQFLGLEINPRAVAIAELVLWIGYLKWHLRTLGHAPNEPLLKDFHNIVEQDAVLAYDKKELVRDDQGKPVSRWDGLTMKKSPVTGEKIPDESARTPIYRYVNPRKAEWPKADYVVGNPPFLGSKRQRLELGDGYVDALHLAYPELSESIDFVMYWWDKAAKLLANSQIIRFGFVTTNSITMIFNRALVQEHLESNSAISLVFAIPDHPWVDESGAAAVRIAISVARRGSGNGTCILFPPYTEDAASEVSPSATTSGRINSRLVVGPDTSNVVSLGSNLRISYMGVIPVGEGFRLSAAEVKHAGYDPVRPPIVIRPYLNGKDLAGRSRQGFIIDFFGLSADQARTSYPSIFQVVMDQVKPERDANRDRGFREKWWLFGRARPDMREALHGLKRYIGTAETAKHRTFMFLPASILPDQKVRVVTSDDAYLLGILSSKVHVIWAIRNGARVGKGNDPVYNNTVCFEPFPFPTSPEPTKQKIRELGETLDAHRKRQQAAHPDLTITDMYNVQEKLRKGETLSAKDKIIHEQGLVSVLKQIHDDLDAAVAEAYSWPADLSDEQILSRLVALNHERAEEERQGIIRWLRPEFQNPAGRKVERQQELAMPKPTTKPVKAKKLAWPKTLAEQVQALRSALTTLGKPSTPEELAKVFKGAKTDRIVELLSAMEVLGQARTLEGGRFAA